MANGILASGIETESFLKIIYLFIFRQRERGEKERERNINLWLPLVCLPPPRALAGNPSICPEWELNQ